MNNKPTIRISLFTKRDWLIILANLFLFSLLPHSSQGQDNPFIKKTDSKKDSVIQAVDYIKIPFQSNIDTNIAHIPLKLSSDSVTANQINQDTLKSSSFLPESLMYLIDKKKDTIIKIRTFFYPHLLKARNLEEINRKSSMNDWAFIIIVTSFLLFAGVQFTYHKRMMQIFKAFLAERFLNQLMRGSDFYKERITYNLYLIFLLIFPLFLFEINQFYQIYPLPRRPFTELLFYFELFVVNLLIYILKVFALRATGAIFKTRENTSEYVMTHFIFSLVQGVMILILVTFIVFTRSFLALQIGVLALIVVYAYQLLRGFMLGTRNSGYSILYLLLFFLTIEILPLLILYKVYLNASVS